MAWPYAAPPGVPKDRTEALRAAFIATMKDNDFLADAARSRLDVAPVPGADIEKLLQEVYATIGVAGATAKLGDAVRGERMFRAVVELVREIGAPFAEAHALHSLASFLRTHERYAEAQEALDEVERLFERHPNRIGQWFALTTIGFHRRDRDLVAERYSADTSRARAALPEGIEAIPLRGAGEVQFWLPRERTLVPGDRVLGGGEGGLRMCPQSWLNYLSSTVNRTDLAELLRPLLDLPIERVLVSHGQPVLAGGRAALAEAIG